MNPADSGSAAATIAETLEQHYPGRVLSPKSLAEIPAKDYLVYVLEHNGRAIVVGHGKKNRARVILDSEEAITPSHLKAIFVRLRRRSLNRRGSCVPPVLPDHHHRRGV